MPRTATFEKWQTTRGKAQQAKEHIITKTYPLAVD